MDVKETVPAFCVQSRTYPGYPYPAVTGSSESPPPTPPTCCLVSTSGALSLRRAYERTRDAMELMLGTDPSVAVPSAVELLQHPWFPVDGVEHKDAVAPGKSGPKVAVGPPVRPEVVPKGLPPMVPKMSTDLGDNGAGGGKGNSASGSGTSSPWVEMSDGSQALCAWLMKRTSERNALGLKSHW